MNAVFLLDYWLVATLFLVVVGLGILRQRQPAKRVAWIRGAFFLLAFLPLVLLLPGRPKMVSLSPIYEANPSQPQETKPIRTGITSFPDKETLGRLAENEMPTIPLMISLSETPERIAMVKREPLSIFDTLFYAQFCGSGILAAWLCLGLLRTALFLRRSIPVPDTLISLVRESNCRVRVRMHPELVSPIIVGFFRPTIVLPVTENTHEIRAAIAHESAHYENGDLSGLALERLVMLGLFFHPLFWWLRKTVRRDQEILADLRAVEQTNRYDYAEQLLLWAGRTTTRRRFADSLGMVLGILEFQGRNPLTPPTPNKLMQLFGKLLGKMLARSGAQRPSRGLLHGAEAPAGPRASRAMKERMTMLLDQTIRWKPTSARFRGLIFGALALVALFVSTITLQPLSVPLRAETKVEPVSMPSRATEIPAADTTPLILDRLHETFQYDAKEPLPLGEALSRIQKDSGIKIVADVRTWEKFGVTAETPVMLHLPVRMPFKDVLDYVGKQLQLGYRIENGVVLFGPGRPNVIRTVQYYVGDLVGKTNDGDKTSDFQPLIDYIQTMVQPESWKENGPETIPYYPNMCLVIRQTDPAHEEIAKLLRGLRRYNDLQLQFKIDVLAESGPIDETMRSRTFTVFNGLSWTVDFPWKGETFVQLTPVSGRPVDEYHVAMNRPIQFNVPEGGRIGVTGIVGRTEGNDTIKFTVDLGEQGQLTRTFYASPIWEQEEESFMLGAPIPKPEDSHPRFLVTYNVSDLTSAGMSFESLAGLIVTVTDANEKDINIDMQNNLLRVEQSSGVHQDIRSLLDQLRELNNLEIDYIVESVSQESFSKVDREEPQWDRQEFTLKNGQTKTLTWDSEKPILVRISLKNSETEPSYTRVSPGQSLGIRGVITSDRQHVRVEAGHAGRVQGVYINTMDGQLANAEAGLAAGRLFTLKSPAVSR